MGNALIIIGAIITIITGIVNITKKHTDEETERKSKKAGYIGIIAGIILLIYGFFF